MNKSLPGKLAKFSTQELNFRIILFSFFKSILNFKTWF